MAERVFSLVNVIVYYYGPPSLTVVSWDFEPSVIPLNRYDIYIYRGESETEMPLLAGPIKAEMQDRYEDRTSRLLHSDRFYYYQVEAVNKITGNKIRSEIVTMAGVQDVLGNYVVTEHNFLFREVIGLPCYVYKKQTKGTSRCSNCWDPVLKRTTKSMCNECHGTGFTGYGIGGYYNPAYTWIDFSQEVKAQTVTQWGASNSNQSDIFMSNYPILSVGDLIIELTGGKVWKVFNVRETERRRTPMLQLARIDEMDKDSIEGKIISLVPDEIFQQAKRELNDRKYTGDR